MSTISPITTWASQQVLTAAALNSEFTNIYNYLNNADAGSSTWANVNATTASTTTLSVLTTLNFLGISAAWQSYTPVVTGCSAAPTMVGAYFQLGKIIFGYFFASTSGTSNATTMTMTLPIAASDVNNFAGIFRAIDSGVSLTTPACMQCRTSSTTADMFKDFAGTGWTNSGLKYPVSGWFMYKAA